MNRAGSVLRPVTRSSAMAAKTRAAMELRASPVGAAALEGCSSLAGMVVSGRLGLAQADTAAAITIGTTMRTVTAIALYQVSGESALK